MRCRPAAALPALVLAMLVLCSGCTSLAAPQGTESVDRATIVPETTIPSPAGAAIPALTPSREVTDQLAAVKSSNPVWLEAYRMFLKMNSTEYVPPPYTVDDAAGIYRFDCLGFVDHVLKNVDPAGYEEIMEGGKPTIESYAAYFTKLDTTRPDRKGWTKVDRAMDLEPGDVCLWLKTRTLNNGHLWIIAGEPQINPKRTNEVLVRVFDSWKAHSEDSRTGSACPLGLGSGVLGIKVDGPGSPVGLYWVGGKGTAVEKDLTIVCGRLNRPIR